MSWDPVAVAATIGGFFVAAVIAWGIFSVGRAAVSGDAQNAGRTAAADVAELQRQILAGQQEAAAVLAELRGSVSRIEAMLKEVG
jgi:hypothetical protein